MDAALLAAQMDRVNAIPFTYEQLDVLKHKLDEVVHDSGSRRPAASKPSPDPGSDTGPSGLSACSSTHKATPSLWSGTWATSSSR